MMQIQPTTSPAPTTTDYDNNHDHLVIHFDINETILLGDAAGGDSPEQCLHKVLAKSAFVRHDKNVYSHNQKCTGSRICDQQDSSVTFFTSSSPSSSVNHSTDEPILNQEQRKFIFQLVPTHWWDGSPIVAGRSKSQQAQSTTPTTTTTSLIEYDEPQSIPKLWTEWEWPPNSCPYYRTSYKKRSSTFALHDGTIYQPIYDRMHQILHPDRFSQKSSDFPKDAPQAKEDIQLPMLSQMLPSFFETLIEFTQWVTTTPSMNITVVLRTFGTDLNDITNAITQFASGQHPDYPHFSSEQYICHPSHIVRGRWVLHPCDDRDQQEGISISTTNSNAVVLEKNNPSQDTYTYELWDNDDAIVASGDAEVLQWIHTLHQQQNGSTTGTNRGGNISICCIQDDYDHWSKHFCAPWAGKPIWKLRYPTNNNDEQHQTTIRYHHILFDDNM
jgi:hypothetical protein